MKINEDNYELIKKASEITCMNYEIKWIDAENIEGYIDNETLLSIINDLLIEIDKLSEK